MTPNPNAIQYIRQYREVYTREAITSQLLSAGYPQQVIDASWAAVESGDTPDLTPPSELPPPPANLRQSAGWDAGGYYVQPRRKAVETGRNFWLTLIGFVLLSILLYVLSIVPYSSFFGYDSLLSTLSTVLCGLAVLAQVVGLVAGLALLNRNRAVAHGLLFGVLISSVIIPAIVFLLLLGTCLVILGGYYAQ